VMSQTAATPDSRKIYTMAGTPAVTTSFDISNGAALYPLILPPASRTATNSATLVYDYNGDSVSDDTDAKHLLQWTRGYEFAPGITYTPAKSSSVRGWRLGSVHNSSPAIVGPPVRPVWIDGAAAPSKLVAAHNTFTTNNDARQTLAVVGAQDGMIHAFNAGDYRPNGDPDKTKVCTTTLYRGCYAGSPANYGTGSEVWAWVPPSQLSQLKNNTPQTKNYMPGSNPLAEVDGSISVDDIWDASIAPSGDFRTVAYASLGTNQRYITAVDMTDPTKPPKGLWAADFTDADFSGANLSPSIGLVSTGVTAPGYREMIVTSSGLNTLNENLFIYEIDALTGVTINKVQLNTGSYTAQATGIASYVNLVDADQDGRVARVYAADTSGRIWKLDTTNNQKCLVASLGETVYAGMAVSYETNSTTAAPHIELYVGGGSNPDGTGTIASAYHFFELEDTDPVGTCTNNHATVISKTVLPTGDRIWAAPTVTDSGVYVATANAASTSICSSGSGAIDTFPLTGDGTGGAVSFTSQAISGAPISSMRVFDGHVLVNTVGGSTTVMGGSTWNNQSSDPNVNGVNNVIGALALMRTLLWQEQ
jgi:type IV pilus assembly protein PilY1